jgi:NAD+ synthase
MINDIVDWLNDYLENASLHCFVVGVSGGIDSAVTSTLAAKTGKPVYVLNMSIHQSKDQEDLGILHMEWLTNNFGNVCVLKFDFSNVFDSFSQSFSDEFKTNLSFASSRSRLRMMALYQIASSKNGLVVGTGNKVEDFGVGFFTKYGDGGVDISPIADLYKSEVYELARKMKILNEIQTATPTDGLWDDGRTDEDQIGATYDELERAMKYKEGNLSERDKTVLDIYERFHANNKHKMIPIPVFRKNT